MIAELTGGEIFLAAIAVALIVSGLYRVIAPARALEWDYRWDDRRTRWFTLGRLKSAIRIMEDQTGRRVTFVVGVISILVGAVTLVAVVVSGPG